MTWLLLNSFQVSGLQLISEAHLILGRDAPSFSNAMIDSLGTLNVAVLGMVALNGRKQR